MQILVLVIVIAAGLYFLNQTANVFVVAIRNGEIAQVRGNVTKNLVNDFAEATKNVKEGKIIGKKRGNSVQLQFRGDIGEFTQQRLRNIFGLHQR